MSGSSSSFDIVEQFKRVFPRVLNSHSENWRKKTGNAALINKNVAKGLISLSHAVFLGDFSKFDRRVFNTEQSDYESNSNADSTDLSDECSENSDDTSNDSEKSSKLSGESSTHDDLANQNEMTKNFWRTFNFLSGKIDFAFEALRMKTCLSIWDQTDPLYDPNVLPKTYSEMINELGWVDDPLFYPMITLNKISEYINQSNDTNGANSCDQSKHTARTLSCIQNRRAEKFPFNNHTAGNNDLSQEITKNSLNKKTNNGEEGSSENIRIKRQDAQIYQTLFNCLQMSEKFRSVTENVTKKNKFCSDPVRIFDLIRGTAKYCEDDLNQLDCLLDAEPSFIDAKCLLALRNILINLHRDLTEISNECKLTLLDSLRIEDKCVNCNGMARVQYGTHLFMMVPVIDKVDLSFALNRNSSTEEGNNHFPYEICRCPVRRTTQRRVFEKVLDSRIFFFEYRSGRETTITETLNFQDHNYVLKSFVLKTNDIFAMSCVKFDGFWYLVKEDCVFTVLDIDFFLKNTKEVIMCVYDRRDD